MLAPEIEVDVCLRFDKSMIKHYCPIGIVTQLFKSLNLDINELPVGCAIPLNDGGIRAYYSTKKKCAIVVESAQATFIYSLTKQGAWIFKYIGQPMCKVIGEMTKVVKFLINYSGVLEVVENESTFPEVHWGNAENIDYVSILNLRYEEVLEREEEILNLLVIHFNVIEKEKSAFLRLEIKQNRLELIDFLVRVMCVVAQCEISNMSQVINKISEYRIDHLKELINMLNNVDHTRKTLLVYGAHPY